MTSKLHNRLVQLGASRVAACDDDLHERLGILGWDVWECSSWLCGDRIHFHAENPRTGQEKVFSMIPIGGVTCPLITSKVEELPPAVAL